MSGTVDAGPPSGTRLRTVGGATLGLALRRNLSKWQPMAFVVVGLVITIALIATIPLFTDAALDRFLRSELAAQDSDLSLSSLLLVHRVPFSSHTPLERYARADRFMRQSAPSLVGLPLDRLTRYGSTRVARFLSAAAKGTARGPAPVPVGGARISDRAGRPYRDRAGRRYLPARDAGSDIGVPL